MNKLLLEKYISVAVQKQLKEEEERQKHAEKSMYLIYKFPGLKKSIEDLMSPAFGRFISGVTLVAPKPTTFRVELANGYDFNIIYLKKNTYSVKISGKKYYLNDLGDQERAIQAIADLLDLSPSLKEAEAPTSLPTEPSTPATPSPEETAKGQELAADLANAEKETPAGPEAAPATTTPPTT